MGRPNKAAKAAAEVATLAEAAKAEIASSPSVELRQGALTARHDFENLSHG